MMKTETEREFLCNSPAQTAQLAKRLAMTMHTPAALHMKGCLGVGKTHFVRSFLRALGVKSRITSPSFSLAETYIVGNKRYGHFDFYRLQNSNDWLASGLDEQLDKLDAYLVEWSENIEMLPEPDLLLQIKFDTQEAQRIVLICGISIAGIEWIGRT